MTLKMKNTLHRTALALTLSLWGIAAHAGPAIDQFMRDIAAYQAAQSTTPDRVIRYSDPQGALARAVLNPAWVQPIMAETLEEVDGIDKVKAVHEAYKPIFEKYVKAFNQLHGKYDAEHLDAFESLLQINLATKTVLQNIKPQDIPDETMRPIFEAAVKMMSAMPAILLKALEKQADDGKFSADFTPVARARIVALRASLPKP